MLTWNQLHLRLEGASNRHAQLAAKFQSFAKFIEEQVTAEHFHIKGISASLQLDKGYFTTTFAGRTVRYTFSSTTSENGTLIGTVACDLLKEHPEKTLISVGGFTFTPNGQTNLKDPEDGDPIIIDSDTPALYVGLHFIHESLSK